MGELGALPNNLAVFVDDCSHDLGVVEEIRRGHEQAPGALQEAVLHAIRCGQLLFGVKAGAPHGSWGAWLDQYFPASRRTAQDEVAGLVDRVYASAKLYRELGDELRCGALRRFAEDA